MKTELIALLVVIVLVFSMVIVYEVETSYRHTSSPLMIDQSELAGMSNPPSGVYVGHHIIYINSSSTIPIEMGPMNANVSMYSFSIYGDINPTLEISQGVKVKFMEINVDTDAYHNFAITSVSPPYEGYNAGMMGDGSGMSMNSFIPPTSTGGYYYSFVYFDAISQGTLWYVCQYPGHAAAGMYGEIVVA